MKKSIFSDIFFSFLLLLSLNTQSNSTNSFDEPNIVNTKDLFLSSDERSDSLQVHFLDVGDGDCVFIKFGNVEILIDSGEKNSTINELRHYIKQYSSDGILEYVIVTHGDSDHLGIMDDVLKYADERYCKSANIPEGDRFKVGQIIDFDNEYNKGAYTSQRYVNYLSRRQSLISQGTKYEKTISFWNDSINKEPFKIELTNGDSIANLYILYNPLYFMTEQEAGSEFGMGHSSYVNSLSICTLIQYGESKYLATADLSEYQKVKNDDVTELIRIGGETNLLEHNNTNGLMNNVTLFKAGHHASATSNSEDFIDVIKPKYVSITCDAGGSSYNFPDQKPLDNILKYTDYITITRTNISGSNISYYGYVDYYLKESGEVIISENDAGLSGNGKVVAIPTTPITQTSWFSRNRVSSIYTYVFSGHENSNNAFVGNSILVKYGHYDILFDCGVYGTIGSGALSTSIFRDKINNYVIDGVLEYVIVTSPFTYSLQQMVDTIQNNKVVRTGILSDYKINYLIDFGVTNDPSKGTENSLFRLYSKKRDELISKGTVYYPASRCIEPFEITNGLNLNILENPYYDNIGDDEFEGAVSSTIEFFGKKMLFTGNITNVGEKAIVQNNNLANVVFFNSTDYGFEGANSDHLLDNIKNDKDRLFISINSIAGLNLFGKKNLTKQVMDRLINCSKYTYLTTELRNGKYEEVNGDIRFRMDAMNDNILSSFLTSANGGITLSNTNYYKKAS